MSDDTAALRPPRVFISYAHERDSDTRSDLVRQLWLFLRSHGIDAHLDIAAADQRQDWAIWMANQIRDADHILVIASPAYRTRAQGQSGAEIGRGVQWEARLIRDAFYRDQHNLNRWVPVVLPGETDDSFPDFLAVTTTTVYHVRAFTVGGAEPLLRLLTGQPAEIQPVLGPLVLLPPNWPGSDEESPAGPERTTETKRSRQVTARQGDRRVGGRTPTPVDPVVFRHNPILRSILLVVAIVLFMVFIGTIFQSILDDYPLQAGIRNSVNPGCAELCLMLILVPVFREKLVLSRRGVYVTRWKTTFIEWDQINAVRVDVNRWNRRRYVTFVLDNRTERIGVLVDGRGAQGRQFDQKASTIQQWYSRFGSLEPS